VLHFHGEQDVHAPIKGGSNALGIRIDLPLNITVEVNLCEISNSLFRPFD
jgi:hypothetical protein